jgi:hypothetical protein
MIVDKNLKNKKQKDLIEFMCDECSVTFYRKKRTLARGTVDKEAKTQFCCRECNSKFDFKKTFSLVECKNCNTKFYKANIQILKTVNNFCCKSCAGTYNSLHRKRGTRRSKLEIWLEEKLPIIYPNLVFEFNQKHRINSELDIYIPSLKLAFELNGIFHYEPIYGEKKFNQIINNDHRKFQACLEHDIELCIIDSSKEKYFKESNSYKYLDIIKNIIDLKLKSGSQSWLRSMS